MPHGAVRTENMREKILPCFCQSAVRRCIRAPVTELCACHRPVKRSHSGDCVQTGMQNADIGIADKELRMRAQGSPRNQRRQTDAAVSASNTENRADIRVRKRLLDFFGNHTVIARCAPGSAVLAVTAFPDANAQPVFFIKRHPVVELLKILHCPTGRNQFDGIADRQTRRNEQVRHWHSFPCNYDSFDSENRLLSISLSFSSNSFV